MADFTLQTQIRFEATSHDDHDAVVQTWYFRFASGSDEDAAAANCVAVLDDFLNGNGTPSGYRMSQYLNSTLSRVSDDVSYKVYNLADAIPRAPVLDATGSLFAPAVPGILPRQVAVALTMQANQEGIAEGQPGVLGEPRPRARRRGRMYLGPLVDWGGSIDNGGFVGPQLIGDLGARAQDIVANTLALAPVPVWVVHSRTDATDYVVTNGWVDNRFDTQRRRVPHAHIKTAW